jgi:hypothetical protein
MLRQCGTVKIFGKDCNKSKFDSGGNWIRVMLGSSWVAAQLAASQEPGALQNSLSVCQHKQCLACVKGVWR